MQHSIADKSDASQSNELGDRISIYQPEQSGLKFPKQPAFESLEEERTHRKQRLVAGCRAFAMNNFDYGMAGHISCLLYTSPSPRDRG